MGGERHVREREERKDGGNKEIERGQRILKVIVWVLETSERLTKGTIKWRRDALMNVRAAVAGSLSEACDNR
ncbi:hypothetical protein AAFF_G00237980 [Aldrovandia affinis]|uniref:Uncharacterized protein n=1 Tax=Aldrovandia affinis TaxID=143900 RepID=A0AAD7RE23_9TELE|nr:hypothetical protein AAFF_G00237980 [Aldrovandia affinis]